MNAQHPGLAISNTHDIGNLAVVAARLVEAACFARDGNREAAKVHLARAIAVLRGEPGAIPSKISHLGGDSLAPARGTLALWQKRRVLTYIDAHLAGRIRIEELAALLSLSERHLARAFRCTFGASTHEYITRRRIEVAQGLMLTSRERLCAIALRCGLSDQSHFTRVFRRFVGETPYAWRRSRRGEFGHRDSETSGRESRLPASVVASCVEPIS